MKQKIFNFALLVAVLLAGTQFVDFNKVSAAGYHSSDPQPCYDITGSSTPVLVDGIANSGVLNFDSTGFGPQYHACVRVDSDIEEVARPTHLEGWVWNDNLGWISLYCKDGQNLGVNCGSYEYAVNVAVTGSAPNFGSVSLSGYAWGDNVGWIKFNSSSPAFRVQAVASGANKGLIDKSMNGGPATSHAWADSVGWFDLSGVKLFWWNEIPPADVEICSSRDLGDDGTGTCACNLVLGCSEAEIPYADNDEYWKVTVNFQDNGTPVDLGNINVLGNCTNINMTETSPNTSEYAACIDMNWFDNVDFDQTTSASQSSSNEFGDNNTGAVQNKPFNFIEVANSSRNISSFAPTSDQNKSQGFSNERFIYPEQGVEDYVASGNGNNNILRLESLKVMLFKYSEDGVNAGRCIYGIEATITCSPLSYLDNQLLGFKPLVEIPKLDQVEANKELSYLSLEVDAEKTLDLEIRSNKPTKINTFNLAATLGLDDAFSKSLYELLFVENSPLNINEGNELNLILPGDKNLSLPIKILLSLLNEDSPAASGVSNPEPYLWTKISYNLDGEDVAYWGNKLPRVKAGLIKNPVAFVKGNVYGTGINQKARDVTVRSLGNIASNLRREVISRNIAKYTANMGQAVEEPQIVDLNNVIGLTELVKGKVYYLENGDLTIDCSGNCTPSSTMTFIVNNGSIVLKSNIKPTGNNQIGLIAMRDLTVGNLNQGNLFIQSNVTDVLKTHIYLDRLIMSCDATCARTTDRAWPSFADDFDRQEKLINQLRFLGTVSSLNGFGNAVSSTPRDEFGNKVGMTGEYGTNDAPTGIARARTADLNFLRYYGPGLEICDGSNVPRDQQLRDIEEAGYGCDPEYPTYEINATEDGDLVAGSTATEGKKSEAYASVDSLSGEYPVYFEYEPIRQDLAGFEVDQSINILTR